MQHYLSLTCPLDNPGNNGVDTLWLKFGFEGPPGPASTDGNLSNLSTAAEPNPLLLAATAPSLSAVNSL